MRQKLLVIIADALSYEWLREFKLTERMINELSEIFMKMYLLRSTIPPTTPPAFTTMVSGVNPAMHGIWGFIDYKSGSLINIHRDSQYPLLWEILSSLSVRSAWLWFPLTYPVPQVRRSIFIAGSPNPFTIKGEHFSIAHLMPKLISIDDWSRKLIKELIESKELIYTFFEPMSLDDLSKTIRSRFKVIESLLGKINVIFATIPETDKVIHIYSSKNSIERVYKVFVSELINIIWHAINNSYDVLVVSDHGGFEQVNRIIFINSILIKKMLSSRKNIIINSLSGKFISLFTKALTFNDLKRLADKFQSITKILTPSAIPQDHIRKHVKVYVPVGVARYAIANIFDKSFRDKVLSILKQLKEEGYIESIHSVREVYEPCEVNCDDFIVKARQGIEISSIFSPFKTITTRNFYIHSIYGVMMLFSKKNYKVSSRKSIISVLDVAPTILSLLKIRPPEYFLGKSIVTTNYYIDSQPYARILLRLRKLRRRKRQD